MRTLLLLAVHLIVTVAKLLQPGGARAVVAESLLLKQQIIIIGNRSRRRAPNLTSLDRFVFGLITLFIRPHRIPKLLWPAIIDFAAPIHVPALGSMSEYS